MPDPGLKKRAASRFLAAHEKVNIEMMLVEGEQYAEVHAPVRHFDIFR